VVCLVRTEEDGGPPAGKLGQAADGVIELRALVHHERHERRYDHRHLACDQRRQLITNRLALARRPVDAHVAAREDAADGLLLPTAERAEAKVVRKRGAQVVRSLRRAWCWRQRRGRWALHLGGALRGSRVMLLQGVDLRKCGGVKPIVVVHRRECSHRRGARRENLQCNRV